MAKIGLYTLHDSKALTYNVPFPAGNHALANRMVQDLAADMNTSVGRHPGDYRLYFLGLYDDTNAKFEALDILEHVNDVIALTPAHQMPFNFAKKGNGSAEERN
jgi:hypothetical protein